MHPFWISLACLASLLTGMTLMYAYRRRLPQHAGAGEGATNVWQLIEHIEAEAAERARPRGRHRLREPVEESTTDTVPLWPEPPPLDLQQRVLESLRRL
ncbi:hypothetical protein [Saccharopolyspora thermophila]|uniref:Secreted protein n=1 Tax=Saccharopolyspora thermophila TaxID=89367 RepID=A0ABP3MRC5_9PSEU